MPHIVYSMSRGPSLHYFISESQSFHIRSKISLHPLSRHLLTVHYTRPAGLA